MFVQGLLLVGVNRNHIALKAIHAMSVGNVSRFDEQFTLSRCTMKRSKTADRVTPQFVDLKGIHAIDAVSYVALRLDDVGRPSSGRIGARPSS